MWRWWIENRVDALNDPVAAFSELSRPAYLLLVGLVVAVLGRRRRLFVWPLTVAVTNLVVHVAKPIISRPRPPLDYQLVEHVSGAMPSGHAAAAAAVAVLAWRLCGARVGGSVMAWAAAVAVSRLYLGVHWLSDVVVGAIVGALVAWAVTAVMGRAIDREDQPDDGES
ncbi:phosphatase PAP2 family protein [Corynebacterium uterequi]|uniref:PAP2 superfamily protein n=1 Tax=Corynebacterium uterequi TaxID=1072256 RepID=A0A0G3HJC2_9CORY|nr:phosphatase PAP2 family protein [Corynebacterium uterequi]AKK12053.1 PAP2 superfamily protein [Corynebacterium uterequi]